jgi:hypothetical protein
LLAKDSLGDISPDQVRVLANKYNIKDSSKKFKHELIQMINLFLIEHLGNWGSDVNDFRSAQKLQNILGISDNDFGEAYVDLAQKIFVDKVNETLNNTKKCQSEENAQFEKLRVTLQIPDSKAEKMIGSVKKVIAQNYMEQMIADERVSPEEIETFDKLCKDLDVEVSLDDKSREVIEKYKRYWIIDNGDLPVFEPGIILQKSELCHYKVNAKLYENRKVTRRVSYGGNTFRFKIAKGWYYRFGDVGVSRKSEDVMTLIDEGVLYVTNKRILFNGSKNNKAIRYNQIIDLTPFTDGVEIIKESGTSPTFAIDCKDGEALTATIARIIRDTQ